MHWTRRGILWSFHALLFAVPLIVLPYTSELFEFNKIILTYLFTILILFFWLSRMVTESRIIFKRTLLDIPILLFLLSQFLSLLFSIDTRTSLLGYYSRFNGGFLSLLSYTILYWSAVSNLDSKNVKSLVSVSLVSGILVSIWGFLEKLGIDSSWWVQDVQNRVFSTLGQPNWLAAYLCALMFIPLANYLKTKNFWSLTLFTLFFLVLLFTRSRSGLLAFGISSVVFWATPLLFPPKLGGNPKGVQKPLLGFVYWILIITTSLLLTSNPVKDLLYRTSNLEPKTSSVAGTSLDYSGTNSGTIRQIVWTGALRIWQASSKNFWLGTGPETFAMSYYQYRPKEHNNTSEWELLYNKAHNEFLNYLATTGLLGLGSYLVLITVMLISFVKNLQFSIYNFQSNHNSKINKFENSLKIDNWQLIISLLAGWLTIPITNFWGFSVVMVQILMFLLPAFAIILNSEPDKNLPAGRQSSYSSILLVLLIFVTGFGIIKVFRYWLTDFYYAKGDTAYQSFTLTSEPLYLLSAYENYGQAHDISPHEPVITSQYGFTTAYMSLATSENDSTSSATLAEYAKALADLSISQSPTHPNLYKTASKSMIVLSVNDSSNLLKADQYLEKAQKLSPTDPRIPYNRGLIYQQIDNKDQAKKYFEDALKLKPDFLEALSALKNL